mmetsp:Transcript_112106/g.280920  ORF Transcript_112106/g.280920 Transcript_112106/m.280920 type:complete len:175 (+) Transcript_112106:241-765(+)
MSVCIQARRRGLNFRDEPTKGEVGLKEENNSNLAMTACWSWQLMGPRPRQINTAGWSYDRVARCKIQRVDTLRASWMGLSCRKAVFLSNEGYAPSDAQVPTDGIVAQEFLAQFGAGDPHIVFAPWALQTESFSTSTVSGSLGSSVSKGLGFSFGNIVQAPMPGPTSMSGVSALN